MPKSDYKPPMSADGQQMNRSETTKALIMRAAISSFILNGYEGSSMREIARAAGASMGLIRYHFGQKRDLYRDTLACISEQYNRVCLRALREMQERSSSPENLIFAWLAAPLTRWENDTVATGEEVLRFLNKMGYEPPALTREVYESHYAYALNEWLGSLRAHYAALTENDWYWCLLALRGMYFNIISHQDCMLWSIPSLNNKLEALKRLSRDAVRMLESCL